MREEKPVAMTVVLKGLQVKSWCVKHIHCALIRNKIMYEIPKGEVHSNVPAEQLEWTSGVQKAEGSSQSKS